MHDQGLDDACRNGTLIPTVLEIVRKPDTEFLVDNVQLFGINFIVRRVEILQSTWQFLGLFWILQLGKDTPSPFAKKGKIFLGTCLQRQQIIIRKSPSVRQEEFLSSRHAFAVDVIAHLHGHVFAALQLLRNLLFVQQGHGGVVGTVVVLELFLSRTKTLFTNERCVNERGQEANTNTSPNGSTCSSSIGQQTQHPGCNRIAKVEKGGIRPLYVPTFIHWGNKIQHGRSG
mmetsp:Transcript_23528/g.38932  ORF Transcript_23528/g.38932 Transcript_23528/m.38932 type:complete len:230 (-) Transcript_23528:758-1447(-)